MIASSGPVPGVGGVGAPSTSGRGPGMRSMRYRPAMRLTRASTVLALVLVASCSESGKRPRYPQRACTESQQARAAGTYDGMQPGHDADVAFGTYSSSCAKGCDRAKDIDQCVEYRLLQVKAQGILATKDALIGYCNAGNPLACTWVEDNHDALQYWDDLAANHDASSRAALASLGLGPSQGQGQAVAEPDTAVGRAVTWLEAEADGKGQHLVSVTDASLQDGGFTHQYFLFSGGYYVFALVADSGTTFTASLGGADFDGAIDLPVRSNPGSGVFVRSVGVTMNTQPGRSNPWLIIRADGSGRGNVRILLFQGD